MKNNKNNKGFGIIKHLSDRVSRGGRWFLVAAIALLLPVSGYANTTQTTTQEVAQTTAVTPEADSDPNPSATLSISDAVHQYMQNMVDDALQGMNAEQLTQVHRYLRNELEDRQEFMTRASFTPEGAQQYQRVNDLLQSVLLYINQIIETQSNSQTISSVQQLYISPLPAGTERDASVFINAAQNKQTYRGQEDRKDSFDPSAHAVMSNKNVSLLNQPHSAIGYDQEPLYGLIKMDGDIALITLPEHDVVTSTLLKDIGVDVSLYGGTKDMLIDQKNDMVYVVVEQSSDGSTDVTPQLFRVLQIDVQTQRINNEFVFDEPYMVDNEQTDAAWPVLLYADADTLHWYMHPASDAVEPTDIYYSYDFASDTLIDHGPYIASMNEIESMLKYGDSERTIHSSVYCDANILRDGVNISDDLEKCMDEDHPRILALCGENAQTCNRKSLYMENISPWTTALELENGKILNLMNNPYIDENSFSLISALNENTLLLLDIDDQQLYSYAVETDSYTALGSPIGY